ncbi:RodZ domain-containing protein [Alicyclobacillus sp.]|uniref:RodZ domain-containing protein n=1 Tax=Alicyclobacillus sp. TaxID=61169 RepID=UPI0025BB40D9|nr:RodZ domain-containing protein [Alicyclobacillus sp.]
MRTLGDRLREQRLRQGMDLDTLQAVTKIRKRYLEAIEAGDWSVLPGDVYARGFVRSYAEAVGLDGRALLEAYVDGLPPHPGMPEARSDRDEGNPLAPVSGDREAPEAEPSAGPATGGFRFTREADSERTTALDPLGAASASGAVDPVADRAPRSDRIGERAASEDRDPVAPRRSSRSTPSPRRAPERPARVRGRREPSGLGWNAAGQVVAVVAVLAVLAGAWWYLEKPGRTGAAQANATAPGSALGGNVTAAGQTANAQQAGGNVTNAAGNATPTGNSTTPANSTGAAPGGSAEFRVVSQSFSNHRQTYLVSTTGPIVAQLTAANGACWVRATVDGKVVDPSDTIPVGQSRTWQGNDEIRIRIGFVPGVTLTLNGQSVTLPDTKDAIDVVVTRAQG